MAALKTSDRYWHLNAIPQAGDIGALIELKQIGKRCESPARVQIRAAQLELFHQLAQKILG